jgi:hypothetical protein
MQGQPFDASIVDNPAGTEQHFNVKMSVPYTATRNAWTSRLKRLPDASTQNAMSGFKTLYTACLAMSTLSYSSHHQR